MSFQQASLGFAVLHCNTEVTLGEESLIKHEELRRKLNSGCNQSCVISGDPGFWASRIFDIKGHEPGFLLTWDFNMNF